MDSHQLRELLGRVAAGHLPVDEAFDALRDMPYSDLGEAQVDHHRALRQGMPEVILAEWKTAEQIVVIARDLLAHRQNVMITRLDPTKAERVCAEIPEIRYLPVARIGSHEIVPAPVRPGKVAVVTAGTSDVPVAEEAVETLRMLGVASIKVFDCGVAGLHRLLDKRELFASVQVVIAVAGMEGALPSVVGGLVACPVIAVPTSVGYGAHFGGITPLLSMLTSCAAGISVVNIDNGFGSAVAAYRILAHAAMR